MLCARTKPLLSCNDIWESFKKCCLLLRDKYVPSKIAKSRCSLPWITNNIKKLIEVQNKLYHQYKQTGSIEIYQQFKEVKHWVQKEMRVAYYNYINNITVLMVAHLLATKIFGHL